MCEMYSIITCYALSVYYNSEPKSKVSKPSDAREMTIPIKTRIFIPTFI